MKTIRITSVLCLSVMLTVLASPVFAGEITGKPSKPRIVWRTDVEQAYFEALDKNKPLFIYYRCPESRQDCSNCKKLRKELESEGIQLFAGDAVFVVAEVRTQDRTSDDKAAQIFFTKFDVKATPTISILEPSRTILQERARISGYFTAEALAKHLHRILREHKPKEAVPGDDLLTYPPRK